MHLHAFDENTVAQTPPHAVSHGDMVSISLFISC